MPGEAGMTDSRPRMGDQRIKPTRHSGSPHKASSTALALLRNREGVVDGQRLLRLGLALVARPVRLA